jgi:hypothetical protein
VDEQTVLMDDLNAELDSNYKMIERMCYCAAVLSVRRPKGEVIIGELVLGFFDRVPSMPHHEILSMIAASLTD